MGAWIETSALQYVLAVAPVAPYVGAWIETFLALQLIWFTLSHPTWVRGLKHPCCRCTSQVLESHPTWVRGLKQVSFANGYKPYESHPTWVRGLKHYRDEVNASPWCRTLRGCVD